MSRTEQQNEITAKNRKEIATLASSAITSVLSIAPYPVITRDDPVINIISVATSNFLVNLYAAYTSLHFLMDLYKKSKLQFTASFVFSAFTALSLTLIAHDESKNLAESISVSTATFLGTAVVNALGLTNLASTVKQLSSLERKRASLLRACDLHLLLVQKAIRMNQAIDTIKLKKIPTPLLLAGWSLEYLLKIGLSAAIVFCAFILNAATEKALRNTLHFSPDAAFASALTITSPAIVLGTIGGWNIGDTISNLISTYYQTGETNADISKIKIALGLISAIIACRSGDASKTLQQHAGATSILKSITNFPHADIAADVSATLFNIYFCFLSLCAMQTIAINRCQKKSDQNGDLSQRILGDDSNKLSQLKKIRESAVNAERPFDLTLSRYNLIQLFNPPTSDTTSSPRGSHLQCA